MLEKFKPNLDYIKPWKTVPAFKEAWAEYKKHKDKGFLEKIKIFWSKFFEEMRQVEEEKEEVSEDTREKVKKGVDETLEDAHAAAKLEKNVEQDDREFFDEILATTITSFEELDEENQGFAYQGFSKAEKALNGKKTEPLTIKEARALSSAGFITLKKLKKKYPKKEEFKKMLDRLQKVSDRSAYPLKKLLSASVLKVFKVKLELPEGLKDLMSGNLGSLSGLSDLMSGNLGTLSEASDIASAYNLGITEMITLADLKNKPMKKKSEVVKVFEKILPHTNANNRKRFVGLINKMITSKKKKLDTKTLTDFVFLIDDSDFERLITVLVGKRSTVTAKAA